MKSISEIMDKGEMAFTQQDMCEMQANSYNAKEGNLKFVDCPICKNKGNVMIARYEEMYHDYVTIIKDCDCMEKRRVLYKAKASGLGDYLTKRFKDYETKETWQSNIKEKAMKYANDEDNSWFVSLGQSGAGKTMICSIIANHLLLEREMEVNYVSWTDFIGRLKRDMMGENTNEVTAYLEDIKNVEVLFIDELLKKYNETDLKYIIEIINYRYSNNVKTIITSEKTIDELIDIDEATFGRVIERAKEYVINIPKDRQKNYRLKAIL